MMVLNISVNKSNLLYVKRTRIGIYIFRDDGSKDETVDIIKKFVTKYSEKNFILNSNQNIGAKSSFDTLLQHTKKLGYYYFMFCDQDDVWLRDKIEKTFGLMRKTEDETKSLPILVYSDWLVVNKHLKVISKSMFCSQKLKPYKNKITDLLIQNNVTGCTVMINRSLADFVYGVPAEAIMHDWWIALIAAYFGIIVCISEPLIKYRQHGKNVLGAVGKRNFLYVVKEILFHKHILEALQKYIKQSQAFKNI